MDVYEAAHRIDVAETIASRLDAAQPKNASEDPVSVWKLCAQTRMKALTGHASPDEDTAFRCTISDLGTHDVATSGSAFASHLLARAIAGS